MYFVGGVGDFSVQLDAESRDLYIFFSQYSADDRRASASRGWRGPIVTAPSGKAMVFASGVWLPARAFMFPNGMMRWNYPSAVPIFPAERALERRRHRGRCVLGAGRALEHLPRTVRDAAQSRQGHELETGRHLRLLRTAASTIHRPGRTPLKILSGGRWYPQVMGIEAGAGTDKVAGRWARFFMAGTSEHLIQFIK